MMIKKRIQLILKETGLAKNISDLEKKLGLSNGTIAHWDVQMPGANNLIKVADYLNCSADYLYGRTDDPTLVTTLDDSTSLTYNIDDLLDRYLIQQHLPKEHRRMLESVVLTYLNTQNRVDL